MSFACCIPPRWCHTSARRLPLGSKPFAWLAIVADPDLLSHWHVRRVCTGDVQGHLLLPDGCPASFFSWNAQWPEYEDPDTGQLVRHFVGPTFYGPDISVNLERKSGATCSVVVVATFGDNGRVCTVGVTAAVTGTVKLLPSTPGRYRITLTLIPYPTETTTP